MGIRFPALLFDLDGTLIDSASDIGEALNRLLEERGREAVTEAQVRHFIGDGARRLVERGFAATGAGLPEAEVRPALDRFLEIYAGVPVSPDCVYPGVVGTLEHLAAAGHRLGLCTNKPEAITRALLDDLDLGRFFGAVVGGDTLPQRKPAPEPLLAALAGLGMAGAAAVMIGDNANDVAAARAAGLPAVAVSYGYPRMPVADLGADRIIDRFADLPGALVELAGVIPSHPLMEQNLSPLVGEGGPVA